MRTIPLLEIDGSFDDYRDLFEAAASAGVRLGWLEWDPSRVEPTPELPRRVVGWAQRRRPRPAAPTRAAFEVAQELISAKGKRQPGVYSGSEAFPLGTR